MTSVRSRSPTAAARGQPGGSRQCQTSCSLFAQSLACDDRVVMEAAGNALAIARILQRHVGEVVLAHAKRQLDFLGEELAQIDAVIALTQCLTDGRVWLSPLASRGLRVKVFIARYG